MALGTVMSFALELRAQTLQEAVGEALVSNPKISASANERSAADQRVNQALGRFFPTVDVKMGTGREYTSSPTTRAARGSITLDRGELGLSVNQILFDGFNTYNRLKQAEAQARSTGAGLQETINKVTMDVVEVYLENLKQERLLAIADERIDVLGQIVGKMEKSAATGMGTDVDANQSRSRLALAESERKATLRKLREAEARFVEVIGTPPNHLSYLEIRQDVLPKSPEAALRVAMEHAPALQVSAADLDAADAEKKMSVSGLLPKINLDLELSDNANTYGTKSYTKSASAMVRLEYNLFRGGSDWSRLLETSKRVYKSQEELEQARRQITKEVSSAWHAVKSTSERLELIEKNLAAQERVVSAYRREEVLGTRSHLDALNVLNEVFTAKQSLAEEKIQWMLTTCKLLSAMGVLTETMLNPNHLSQEIIVKKQGKSTSENDRIDGRKEDADLMNLTFSELLGEERLSPSAKETVVKNSDPASPTPMENSPVADWVDMPLLEYVDTLEKVDPSDPDYPFAIQVGGFLQESSADVMAATLTRKGYQVFVQKSMDAEGRVWQWVWVGRYRTREEAQGALSDFYQKENISAFVTSTSPGKSRNHLSLSEAKPSASLPADPPMTASLAPSSNDSTNACKQSVNAHQHPPAAWTPDRP